MQLLLNRVPCTSTSHFLVMKRVMCCMSPLDILEPVNVYYTSLLAQFRYFIIKETTFLCVSPPDELEPIIFCMKHPPPKFTYIFVLFYFSVVINTDMASV